ncbi:hypothetical protein RCOM_0688100 [Ricinus communis]|uniref:Uncharacterized protein n=1 Tax=Ricinus communis TaxID=3988 RepID=B9S492_RICCO|nr:hypothetical protein RCOM_0688100 [Ricinus communis]
MKENNAGILLGPTFFERCFPDASEILFPPFPSQVFGSLLKIGYILFTFLAGVRVDLNLVRRSGKRIVILAFLIFVFPYLMSQNLDIKFDPKVPMGPPAIGARLNNADLYFGAFTTSQFVDASAILMQLKISNSRIGHITLATTLLSDLTRYVYHNIVAATLNRLLFASSVRVGILFFIHLMLYTGFILIVVRRAIFWFIRTTPEGKPIRDIYMISIIAVVLVLSLIGDGLGMDLLLGPLVVGLIIPAGSPLAITITSKFETIVLGLLVPLLSTYCATKFDLWEFFAHFDDALNFQISLIGYWIKVLATFIFLLALKINLKEAVTLALLLNSKGPRYRKKCIQYTSNDAKLEILVCANKQEDALSTIRLLELSNPSKESPMTIYGLCLDELLGSDTPYIINHQLGQRKSASRGSRSQPIIDIFKYFMLEHQKVAQVEVFTAVSPLKSMHEDICWQAFDKTCSFIVLPFHQKWNSKGKIVSNSNELRNLNINVLERAPCSVGILIDRSRSQGISSIFAPSATYRVVALFIGGQDDREALAYALRMAGSRKVLLTVLCFITPDDTNTGNTWEDMLDHEALRKLKQEMSMIHSNINYIEETVRDGSDTASIVRSAQENYDLILVGRRHDSQPEAVSGLSQWTEFPELGAIGDQLATSEIATSISVLVVQQQILKASHSSILN